MTAADLSKALGHKLDRRETCAIWRAGFVYLWSPVFRQFVQGGRVAVRPGEDLSGHERAQGGLIAIVDI